MSKNVKRTLLVVGLVVCLPTVLPAQPLGGGSPIIAQIMLDGPSLTLQPDLDFQRAALEIIGPEGSKIRRAFDAGDVLRFDLTAEDGQPLPDGRYTYLLRLRVDGLPGNVVDLDGGVVHVGAVDHEVDHERKRDPHHQGGSAAGDHGLALTRDPTILPISATARCNLWRRRDVGPRSTQCNCLARSPVAKKTAFRP